ncbi:hypothetical protein H1P_470022 [Hyella patelloides LEGE 07179]|uniref:Uncharacterized protein n=1 Tax=Hyella patelloides LEGE 07179 TaxID=945734 RepID=A0A563VYV7_9CYAN|nr:hypothetical protein H1P_470022 [Hyella patelloides LEGE 07179]
MLSALQKNHKITLSIIDSLNFLFLLSVKDSIQENLYSLKQNFVKIVRKYFLVTY